MSKISTPAPASALKAHFMTLRVTEDFREELALRADESCRSMSSQALYYMRMGMAWEAHRERAVKRPEGA
jgi:hypothetical protein